MMIPLRPVLALATLLALTAATSARAEKIDADKPRWEFGMFGGAARFPEYPGSDYYRLYYLPLPFFVYRGEVIEASDRDVSGVFLRTDHLEGKLSFAGHPPVNRDGNREGMDDLPPLVELGVMFNAYAINEPLRNAHLQAALREAFSLEFAEGSYRAEGQRLALQFVHRDEALFGDERWHAGTRIGAQWISGGLSDFFYSVKPGEEAPGRPVHEAEDGYAGLFLSQSISHHLSDQLQLAAFVSWQNLDGVAFEHSPMVREKNNFYTGAAVIWTIAESAERVKR